MRQYKKVEIGGQHKVPDEETRPLTCGHNLQSSKCDNLPNLTGDGNETGEKTKTGPHVGLNGLWSSYGMRGERDPL